MNDYEISFNPRASVPEFAQYERQRRAGNLQARSEMNVQEVEYGEHARRRLDVYRPSDPTGDVHVFFHGGYWRAGDKSNFAFLAKALVSRGITTVISNYELCGPSRFEDVVDSACSAFAWVLENIGHYGGLPDRISISGHSAGAYLCACLLTTHWTTLGGPPLALKGALLVSGIYEPAKAIGTSINQELRLTDASAARFNLAHVPWKSLCRARVVAGSDEPAAWKDMSRNYHQDICKPCSPDSQLVLLPGHNHFSILDEFAAGGLLQEMVAGLHHP